MPASNPLCVRLANGYQLQSGWVDKDDPDALPAGDYLSVLDANGEQVFYVDSADLFGAPEKGRKILYEMLQACLGVPVMASVPEPQKLD